MSPIPSSQMPGHKQIHERVFLALDRCQELRSVDFKESATWDNLKIRIVKTCFGMGNLRDGGVVIIGVSERGDNWELTGISDEHLLTYNPDDILDLINKYASPPISLDIVIVEHRDKKKYLAIQVSEFPESPFVCKIDGPIKTGAIRHFYAGDFYVRPIGKPQTVKATNAEQMRELLEVAAEKTARRMLGFSKRVGMAGKTSDIEFFSEEIKWIYADEATKLPVPVIAAPHWEVIIHPKEYSEELIPTLADCYKLIGQTKVSLRGWDYPHLSREDNELGHGTNWIASWSSFRHFEYWRLFQSSQFVHLFTLPEMGPAWNSELKETTKMHLRGMHDIDFDRIPGYVSIGNFIYTITEIFEFATRLAQKGIYTGDVSISIKLHGIKGFVLTTSRDRAWWGYYAASENVLVHNWEIPSAELVADSSKKSLKAISWFFERFGWLDQAGDAIREDQEKFLKKLR